MPAGPTDFVVSSAIATPPTPTWAVTLEWNGEGFDYFELQSRPYLGTWTTLDAAITDWSYEDHPVNNQRTEWRIRGYIADVGWSSWSTTIYYSVYSSSASDSSSLTDYVTQDGDGPNSSEKSDIVTVTDSVTDTADVYEPMSDTATASDWLMDSVIEKLNLGRFVGNSNGEIFLYGHDYHGDDTVPIPAWWESKDIDMDDQFPQYVGKYKYLHTIKLSYVDVDIHEVTMSVSTDGGVNWTSNTKTIGTGAGGPAEKLFNFWLHGRTFMVRVAHSSADKDFRWTALELNFEPAGDYFEVS